VQKLLAQVRRWGRPPTGPAPVYDAVCSCGAALHGARQARRQVVPCPSCGRSVFVMAWSCLPSPEAELAPQPTAPRRRRRPWILPLAGAGVTLTVLILLFLLLRPFLSRPTPAKDQSKPPAPDQQKPPDVRAMTTAGRRALAEGDFHLGAQLLQSALDQDPQRPGSYSASERRDATQLWRQADLLSWLSSRSVEEIVEAAEQVPHPEEWKAQFYTEYKGKAIVFDDEVQFEAAPMRDDERRRPVLRRYRIVVAGQDVRIALEDLTVLGSLPLERPQRMLFGGRLAAVERGQGGRWVVHFEPDSGVLLTDRGAAEAVCPAPLDPGLMEVLKRQAEWLGRQTESRP